jgi:hypothetical protein
MENSSVFNHIWLFLFILHLMLFAVLVVSEDGQQQGIESHLDIFVCPPIYVVFSAGSF